VTQDKSCDIILDVSNEIFINETDINQNHETQNEISQNLIEASNENVSDLNENSQNINENEISNQNIDNNEYSILPIIENENPNGMVTFNDPNTYDIVSSSIPTPALSDIPSLSYTPLLSDTASLSDIPSDSLDNLEGDLELLKDLISKYTTNPSIGYLNINSLRGDKFQQLENICKTSKIDILCIDESKLSPEIPTSRIHIDGYKYPPLRRDRIQKTPNSFGGGKVVYIREGFIGNRLPEYETKTSETICIELALWNKKWFIMFGYRPESINRDIFFDEINITLSKAINKYDNILFIGDLNIDLSIPNHDKKHFLEDLCDVFDLTNMVKDKTCFMSAEGSSIDVMLTNKPRSFYKTTTIETGLSDHHKLILTFLRSHHSLKQKPKNIIYRDKKNINIEDFKNDISNLPLNEIHRFSDSLTGFVTLFKSIVDRHAPIKKRTVRGNNKPFMNSELSNAIKHKSKIRNKYNKWRSRENYLEWQNIKKKCKFLTKKAEK
jgi:hypothetical protein